MGYISKLAVLAGVLGACGLMPCTSALLAQVDMGCSDTVANPCSGSGASSSSVNSYQGPSQADIAASQAAQARQQRLNEALAANAQGVISYTNSDWRSAVASFEEAANKNPSDPTIQQNLKNAREMLARAEAELRAQQRAKVAAGQMQQTIQSFANSLKAAPSSGGLDFDSAQSGFSRGRAASNGGLDFTSALPAVSPQRTRCGDTGSTMVVNACNVPSGLPRSVDEAIPHTPAGEGVRKGFQAIQAGNWKAALAWFQAAVKKEPNNPSLKRLVDLAEFTLYYRPKIAGSPSGSAAAQTDRSPGQKSGAAAADRPAVEQGDAKGHAGVIEQSAAASIAARARAQAAWERYKKEYGDHISTSDRAKIVQAAERGDGYSDEELKSQLHNALLEYRKAHKGQIPAGRVGGTAAVEDIVIGGKG